ncbi:MAG: serine/threonine-protein kinase [candidate division Zixibacteria bacterium]|nr:serine/threonine-protein kinase [candidate division Zixibacteria bacterium]
MMAAADNQFPEEFTVIREIGRGGTSQIFLANRRGQAGPVALKLFFDPAATQLIERESLIAARAKFPGIVRVGGVGETAVGRLFLRMEYCGGPTLESLAGKVSEIKLLSILSAVTASLAVLHTAGFAHNDLKPSNIFCPVGFDRDDYPLDTLHYLKLSDFSLARTFSNGEAEPVTGTVGYMSPEMILRRPITPASDLFSLGVMAYYLACGVMPFRSSSADPLEINAQVTEGERPALCGLAASFSRTTADLIAGLMQIDPRRRPPSAWALLETLVKAGSPYPFRRALRPRHLLGGINHLDTPALKAVFGEKSFSSQQFDFVEQTTGGDPAAVRILLEHNFDRGEFGLRDGAWGWRHETPDAMEWSRRQIRFALRPLQGRSYSIKCFAMGLPLTENPAHAATVAEALSTTPDVLDDIRETMPVGRVPALLYSLRQVMSARTRRILARRLARQYKTRNDQGGLCGRLLYEAGQYDEAFPFLATAADEAARTHTYDLAFTLIDVAVSAADKLDDPGRKADALLKKSRLHKDLGRLLQAEYYYNQVIHMTESNADLIPRLALACKELGDVHKARSAYNAGIDALTRALELYGQLGDQLEISHTLNNLGNIYWMAGRLDDALTQYEKALETQVSMNSEKDIASSLNNIGTIYGVKGKFADAISHFTRSLNISLTLDDKGETARTWNNLGVAYFLAGQNEKAVEAYNNSLAVNRTIGSLTELVWNIENLAEVMIQAGRLNDALSYLKEGSALAAKMAEESHQSAMLQLTGNLLRRMGYYADAQANLTRAMDMASKTDGWMVILTGHLNLARFHADLKELDAAKNCGAKAWKIADANGDMGLLFQIALLRYAMSGEESFRKDAENIAGSMFSPRDKAFLHLIALEKENERQAGDDGERCIGEAGHFYESGVEDIDCARYHLAAGQWFIRHGRNADGLGHLERALLVATALNLLPEQWRAAAALSEVAFLQRDIQTSFRYAQQAMEALKKIAAKMKSPAWLETLYADKRVVGLLERVKSLEALLVIQKGAAVGSP